REEARNSLESFVYRVQDLLSDKDLIKVTTEKQRLELSSKASETSDWLYGEGEESSTEEFQIRLRNLRSLEQPITYRYEELTRRPDAVRAIQSVIKKTREFIDQLLNSTTEDQLVADADLDRLISVCRRVEQWLDEKLFEQERIPLHIDPVLTSSDIEKKVREIERELLFLATRRPPKNTSSPNDSQSTSSADKSASQTTALTGETTSTNIPPKKHEEL
ncbi:17240_t:CDS:2, partial [Acaulospora morrowiae]